MNESLRLLFDQGGPILRYLVATELATPCTPSAPWLPTDRQSLESDLLASAEVQRWLGNLAAASQAGIRPNTIHGSSDTCYENAIGKLVQYGVPAGMSDFDVRTEPFQRWLAEFPEGGDYLFGRFYATLVASTLAMAGYRDEPVIRVLQERLAYTYRFCRQGRYDIYADKSGFRRMPEVWANVPLISPALYPEDNFCLPWIHDFNGYAALFAASADGQTREMVDTVVRYVLDPQYQALSEGYGIVTDGKGRYWSMGWSIHLPGFAGAAPGADRIGLIGRLMTMSAFPVARNHPWFTGRLEYLESFRTPQGTYIFPYELLPEKKNSAHCGLGENRRRPRWAELESTYWMNRLRA